MASSLPWAWIIETLADFKPTQSHLLQSLMRSAPDFSNDLCEIARERVSLRILEDIVDLIPSDASVSSGIGDEPSSSGRDFRIDVSDRAEDVLYKVTTSDLTHGVELKQALSQFIFKKRACLPKHALEQLKELILEGDLPSAPSLMEKSGLAKEESPNCLGSGRLPADSIGDYDTSNRLKVSNATAEIASLEQNLSMEVLEHGNTNSQEGTHNQISIPKLVDKEREPSLANIGGTHDEKAEPVKPTSQHLDGSSKIPLQPQINGVHETMQLRQDIRQTICVEETLEKCFEPPETSGRSFGNQNTGLNYDLDDEMVDNEKRQFISSQNTASHTSQAGVWTEQSSCIKCDEDGQLLICSGGSCPIAVHEGCLGSPASFEGTDFYCPFCSYARAHSKYRKAKKKISLARKALSSFMGKDLVLRRQQRQPVGAHNKLSEAARNANCSDKINANKECREIIDNHISTRVMENQEQEKSSNNLSDNLPCREAATTSLNSERNVVPINQGKGGTDMTFDNNQCKTAAEPRHQADVATSSSNDNLPCKEVDTSVIIERHDVSSVDVEENLEEILEDSQCIREAEHQQQKEAATVCHNDSSPSREADIGKTHNVINGKGDTADMIDNHQCMNDSTQQRRAETCINHITGITTCLLVEDSPTAERRARVKRKNAVLKKSPHQETPAQQNINTEETARNQKEEDLSSNKRTKRGRAAKRYSNPLVPHLRRTKLLWTPEEEEVLKEAVQKFSKPGQGNLPWTRIMEFGSNVFHRTRTPVDLKDKWRNIMKKEGSATRKK